MKNYLYRTFLVVSATIAAVGCGDRVSESVSSSAKQQASRESAESIPAPYKVHLMHGYDPTFVSRVRSHRIDALPDGQVRKVVIMEYYVPDDAVGELLALDLRNAGLEVKGPEPRNGAIRYIAQNSNVGRMTADITADPNLELPPEAQGTIYFSWIETKGER